MPSGHLGFSRQTYETAIRSGLDGVITCTPFDRQVARLISRIRVPVIAMHDSWMHRRECASALRFALTDHVEVGRTAARYLLSLGRFATFAYLGDTERNRWGRARKLGFERELSRHGIRCQAFEPRLSTQRLIERTAFSSWLAKLPRPIALFAANDRMAAQAIACCRAMSVEVPKEVAVLGVDNDEMQCASCEPRLSSIQPKFVETGYAAAATLDCLLHGGGSVPKVQLFGIVQVVERASTRPLSPSVKLTEDALAFIDANASAALTPELVARHLGVSRQLLDLRFRELHLGTVAGAIRKARLAEVQRLLRETRLSIRIIGSRCGFRNELSLKNIFRRQFGQTMTDYRRQAL